LVVPDPVLEPPLPVVPLLPIPLLLPPMPGVLPVLEPVLPLLDPVPMLEPSSAVRV